MPNHLDLFTHLPFKNHEIIEALESEFVDELSIQLNKEIFSVFGFIQNIKVDFVKHSHPLLKNPETLDGIRLYHIQQKVSEFIR